MISGSIGPEGDSIDLNSTIPFLKRDFVQRGDGAEEKVTMTDDSFYPFSWKSKTVGEKLSLSLLSKESATETNIVDSLNSFSHVSIPSLDSNNRAIIGIVNPDGTSVRKRSFSQLGYNREGWSWHMEDYF
jgi:hypothetical protein